MHWRYRVRLAVNLVNGSTLAGLAVSRAGRARLARFPDGVLVAAGYRLPVPPAPAFTLGNVVITGRPGLDPGSALLRHEARHCTQYAWSGGLAMLPLYFAAAGISWLLSGDFGTWNIFERGAGLADGGYNTARPWRPALEALRVPFLRVPFLRAPFLRTPFLRVPFRRAQLSRPAAAPALLRASGPADRGPGPA